jgi:hypothetical protein
MKTEENKAKEDPTAPTIRGFCLRNKFSPATYYKIKRLGAGPRELRLPGNLIRITPAAEAEWRRRWENPAPADAEALACDAERRQERSRKAAKKAVESPKHVSRRAVEAA